MWITVLHYWRCAAAKTKATSFDRAEAQSFRSHLRGRQILSRGRIRPKKSKPSGNSMSNLTSALSRKSVDNTAFHPGTIRSQMGTWNRFMASAGGEVKLTPVQEGNVLRHVPVGPR